MVGGPFADQYKHRECVAEVDVKTAGLATHQINYLGPDTYYFVITTINSSGAESAVIAKAQMPSPETPPSGRA